MKKIFITNLLILNILFVFGQAPSGYYTLANGKMKAELKTMLFQIINAHTQRTYAQLWTDFVSTDSRDNEQVWDMYSNCDFTFGTDQCGNYNSECNCYNREHTFPASWFGGSTSAPMYTDLFHLVPTDGWVNNKRGNLPLGEVSSASYVSGNGSKVGTSGFDGYSGTVFEPVDEYKGDFARIYFYVVTCYENNVASWYNYSDAQPTINGTTYPAFQKWAINLLLKWSRQDPVSQKEIDRNNAVYSIQNNRNPFVDHPELAEYIWGMHTNEPWTVSDNVDDITTIPITIVYNKQNGSVQIICEQTFNSFTLTNLSGQTVTSGAVDGNIIQLNPLANGLYLITLNNNSIRITQKLLVF